MKIEGEGTYTLAGFGYALETLSEWGVEVSGTADIEDGNWYGNFEDVVEAIGNDFSFSVSWDEEEHVVTLTGS